MGHDSSLPSARQPVPSTGVSFELPNGRWLNLFTSEWMYGSIGPLVDIYRETNK